MTQDTPKIVVAIDGFSSSGKSTMARRLASQIGYRYIDSGAMYRAVALYGLEHGMVSADGTVDEPALIAALPDINIDFIPLADGSQHTMLNGVDVEHEIRQLRVSNVVSPVAAIPAVRHILVEKQQRMGHDKGIVMDGRDIGTTVFPDAELKIYVDASAQTRAQRRFKELVEKGSAVTFEEVLANVMHRDMIDRSRAESPLRRADDAIAIDNSAMSLDEQDEWLFREFQRTIKNIMSE
ncbi:MAG: (d)CMP kinase [Bacteroidales bacterium]|nr:(d)CMP kinase [Bacteroidales bacterium]